MIINYFKIEPLNINKSKLDEYEKYFGNTLYKVNHETILKFASFRYQNKTHLERILANDLTNKA
ncbi:LIMLP_19325 family protein [Leptospira alexanderi]|uniref:LIMLP_19325 family protein n=1 Tax=Leptospira alexanderi TaxID=100053 RepID=UPI00028A3A83|nr:hypothetical protein [Leptospira alexanderi]